MFTIKRRSVTKYKGLFSRFANASETKIVVKFFSYPAQKSGRGMFIFVWEERKYISSHSNSFQVLFLHCARLSKNSMLSYVVNILIFSGKQNWNRY